MHVKQAPLTENAQWMQKHAPHLVPWANQGVNVGEATARAHMPFQVRQVYAKPTAAGMLSMLNEFEELRTNALRYRQGWWPMLEVCLLLSSEFSSSTLPFEVNAALAYGVSE